MQQENRSYESLKKRLKKQRFTHNLAGKYYGSLYQKLTIPTIVITGLVSMGGFLASSEILSDEVKNGFTITVGILGSISTIIQSILHSCEYATKKKMFEQAADDYDKLLTKLEFLYLQSQSQPETHSETNETLDFNNELTTFEEEILNIKNKCIYLPPLSIIEKWRKHKKSSNYDTHSLCENIHIPSENDSLLPQDNDHNHNHNHNHNHKRNHKRNTQQMRV